MLVNSVAKSEIFEEISLVTNYDLFNKLLLYCCALWSLFQLSWLQRDITLLNFWNQVWIGCRYLHNFSCERYKIELQRIMFRFNIVRCFHHHVAYLYLDYTFSLLVQTQLQNFQHVSSKPSLFKIYNLLF